MNDPDLKENEVELSDHEMELAKDKEFFPKGAIVFFILFTILMISIWGFIYFIMLSRA